MIISHKNEKKNISSRSQKMLRSKVIQHCGNVIQNKSKQFCIVNQRCNCRNGDNKLPTK